MWAEATQLKGAEQVKNLFPALLTTMISIVGGVGSAIGLARTSLDLFESRSLMARRNSELERAGKLADLLGKFSSDKVNAEHREGLTKSVHAGLQQCLAN